MTDQQQGDGGRGSLRAARIAQGWSQSEAARALVELGRKRGAAVAAAASLKSLLSRWENGHAVPERQYRELLSELYGRTTAELGLALDPAGSVAVGGSGLVASLAAARAASGAGLALWREQLELAYRIDSEMGAAGAALVVDAQVTQLELALLHTVTTSARAPVSALLAEAACLQGTQLLDAEDPAGAWRAFATARSAATEAVTAGPRAHAVAGLAAVLGAIGESAAAAVLLDEEAPRHRSGVATAAWATARGLAAASAGDHAGVERWFGEAARSISSTGPISVGPGDSTPIDVVDVRARFGMAAVDLDLRHGHALVGLDTAASVAPLERALSAAPGTARDRAQVHADLAVALAAERPDDSADHARQARELAIRIGSRRTISMLDAAGARS